MNHQRKAGQFKISRKQAMIVGVFCLLCAALPSYAQTKHASRKYKVVYLGRPDAKDPNSSFSPIALSNSGAIVGQAYDSFTRLYYAAKWDKGHFYRLGVLPANPANAEFSSANGINDYGLVAGISAVSATSDHAVIFERGKVIDLGASGPLKGLYSTANDINDAGQVIGNILSGSSLSGIISQPFVYQNGKVTILDAPFFEGNSSVVAINQWGLMVGTTGSRDGEHAFSYVAGKYTNLGSLGSAGSTSSATLVNNRGWIAGTFGATPADSRYSFFLYQNGKMHDIGLPPQSGGSSHLGGMNDCGHIVAYSVPDFGPSFDQAFLYEEGIWQDLQQFIDPKSSWLVTDAIDINDSGEILGFGTLLGPTGYIYRFTAILLVPECR
jgi:uncharacterized membrane protein